MLAKNTKFLLEITIQDTLNDTKGVYDAHKAEFINIPAGTIFVFKQRMLRPRSTEWDWYWLPQFNKYFYAHTGWHNIALKRINYNYSKVWRELVKKVRSEK